ncbi:imidazole glycerol phosphate synthase subunit HisF [Marinifilum sp. JC120]|nr:imidazole glycerol phosphate synthase subunit HisF [Marinifilum sp. JC120]
MLKKRVIPTLLYRDYGLIKGVAFDSWRHVGSLMQSISVYNMRDVDELVFLDITATNENRSPDFNLVDDFADSCFMPLTIGGGISSIEDVGRLLEVGADKIAINSAAIKDPNLVTQIANKYGAQCVVASIDYKKEADGTYQVYTNSGKNSTGKTPLELAKILAESGAGEIMLTSIDLDGTMDGYCLDVSREIIEAVNVPVIVSGGAGSYQHMAQALELGASAVAAASIFHFTEQTPKEARKFLHENGFHVRI